MKTNSEVLRKLQTATLDSIAEARAARESFRRAEKRMVDTIASAHSLRVRAGLDLDGARSLPVRATRPSR